MDRTRKRPAVRCALWFDHHGSLLKRRNGVRTDPRVRVVVLVHHEESFASFEASVVLVPTVRPFARSFFHGVSLVATGRTAQHINAHWSSNIAEIPSIPYHDDRPVSLCASISLEVIRMFLNHLGFIYIHLGPNDSILSKRWWMLMPVRSRLSSY